MDDFVIIDNNGTNISATEKYELLSNASSTESFELSTNVSAMENLSPLATAGNLLRLARELLATVESHEISMNLSALGNLELSTNVSASGNGMIRQFPVLHTLPLAHSHTSNVYFDYAWSETENYVTPLATNVSETSHFNYALLAVACTLSLVCLSSGA